MSGLRRPDRHRAVRAGRPAGALRQGGGDGSPAGHPRPRGRRGAGPQGRLPASTSSTGWLPATPSAVRRGAGQRRGRRRPRGRWRPRRALAVRLPKVESPPTSSRPRRARTRPDRRADRDRARARGRGCHRAHSAVTSVGLGEADLASDLGSADDAVLDWARVRLLVAARAAGKPPPMMSVYADIRDLDGLAADTRAGQGDGFRRPHGDPSQPAAGHRCRVHPHRHEVAWASEVLTATPPAVSDAASGEMVDPRCAGGPRRSSPSDARPAAQSGDPPAELLDLGGLRFIGRFPDANVLTSTKLPGRVNPYSVDHAVQAWDALRPCVE